MKQVNIEKYIIIVLWIGAILSYSIAIVNGYDLYLSDFIGIAGILIVTIISKINQKLSLPFLMSLLFIGMLDIASFVYFIDLKIRFGVLAKNITPAIQAYSLLLLFVLIVFRRPIIIYYLKKMAGITKEDKEQEKAGKTSFFYNKFSKLSDLEIEKKLKLNLSEEAILALKEIQENRKAQKQSSQQ